MPSGTARGPPICSWTSHTDGAVYKTAACSPPAPIPGPLFQNQGREGRGLGRAAPAPVQPSAGEGSESPEGCDGAGPSPLCTRRPWAEPGQGSRLGPPGLCTSSSCNLECPSCSTSLLTLAPSDGSGPPLPLAGLVPDTGFPGGASDKEPACQSRIHKRCWFDPWVRKIPFMRAWQTTPVFSPGEFHGQRSLAGYGPWGHRVRHGGSGFAPMGILGCGGKPGLGGGPGGGVSELVHERLE